MTLRRLDRFAARLSIAFCVPKRTARILAALSDGEPCGQDDLAQRIGSPAGHIHSAIRTARNALLGTGVEIKSLAGFEYRLSNAHKVREAMVGDLT